MPSLAAFILLAVVTGGTPSQRASMEKLVEGLPDCLTKPGGTAIPISIVPSGELNASYSPQSDSLTIHDSLLDDSTRKSAVEELAAAHCEGEALLPFEGCSSGWRRHPPRIRTRR